MEKTAGNLPDSFKDLITRMMKPDPKDRFENIAEIMQHEYFTGPGATVATEEEVIQEFERREHAH